MLRSMAPLLLAIVCGLPASEKPADPKPTVPVVPGLSPEEVAAQPPAPALPDDVDANTTPADLSLKALIMARSEIEDGLLSLPIEKRRIFLVHVWTPQIVARQERLALAKADREVDQKRSLDEARRQTEWRLKERKADDEHAWQMFYAQHRRWRVLTPAERAKIYEIVVTHPPSAEW